MTAYALGFVAACFVGMFVAGIISDWLNRREARRISAVRAEESRKTLAYLESQRQITVANAAKVRRAESPANQRRAAEWFGGGAA